MPSVAQLTGQLVTYAAIAALFGYLSAAPVYRMASPADAMVKVSFAHGAKPKGECRRLTADEIAALAPNMRRPTICPRERLPVLVEVEIDGRTVIRDSLPPTGLRGDGPARIYRKFSLPPGQHRLTARLRDTDRREGFDYVHEAVVDLAPKEILVIDFKADKGGFLLL